MMKKTVGNKKKFQENFLIDKSIGRDVTLIVQNFGPAEITQIEVEYNDESKILISEQGLSITSPYEVKLDTTSSLDVRFFIYPSKDTKVISWLTTFI